MTFRWVIWAISWVLLVSAGVAADELSSLPQRRDEAQLAWRLGDVEGPARILQQRCLPDVGRNGEPCQWFQISGDGVFCLFLVQDIRRTPVIEELCPSIWLKADRPGVRIAARIVLPRTAGLRSERPLTATIFGDEYRTVGRWQQLRLENIPLLLTRQVHVLRMEHGPQVDPREAYLDRVLIEVSGPAGVVNLWVEDVEVAGGVVAAAGVRSVEKAVPVRLPPVTVAQPPRQSVKLVGSMLLVDGRPFFPRAIQYQGEPLAVLQKLGFNAVWMQRAPTPEMLEEADRLGLWLICPPPQLSEGAPAGEIGRSMDCVLVWNLGEDLGEADVEFVRSWAERVRTADRRMGRPTICKPRTDLRSFSRPVDLLLLDRRPLASSLEMADYAAFLRRQPLLAGLGTPFWTTIQTQPGLALRRQVALLTNGEPVGAEITHEQMRLQAFAAVSAGSRGLLFLSDSPLDSQDAATRRRALAVELLNLELALIAPWAAAGSFLTVAEAGTAEVLAMVLRADRARLLLPTRLAAGSQCVPPRPRGNELLRLVVPGVPEAVEAYQFTAAGLQPLDRKRVAGGVALTLDDFDLAAQVLLAHDPVIIDAIHRRIVQYGRRWAELERALAVERLNFFRQTAEGLKGRKTPLGDMNVWLSAAVESLRQADAALTAGDLKAATRYARQAERYVRAMERSYWEEAQRGLVSPATSPLALCFGTLPWHWQMVERLSAGRFGPNLLAGGDFEDLPSMLQAGWQNLVSPSNMFRAAAELSPAATHSGRMGLRMWAEAADRKNPPAALETPPVAFLSPVVNVPAGGIVCIHGWVRMTRQPSAGEGLAIIESLGGETLADYVTHITEWREFALYRAAAQSGPLQITFALTGFGEVWLDDVTVRIFEPSARL